MRNFLFLIILLFVSSCSDNKYNYRANAKSFAAQPANNQPQNVAPAFPRSALQQRNIPAQPSYIPNQYSNPYLASPQQVNPNSRNVARTPTPPPAPRYPYPAYQQARERDLTSDFYGRREVTTRNNYPYAQQNNVNEKKPGDFDPITAGYEDESSNAAMGAFQQEKFDLISEQSFGPGSEFVPSPVSRRAVGFENQERVINDLDNNILDTLISDDPLAAGFYPEFVPNY